MDDIGECVVLFDEFAKTYEHDGESVQDNLLTFFDGTMSSKRLSIVTENHLHSVSAFLTNRPGRMFYHFEYDKLDEDVISEVCADLLKNDKTSEIIELSRKVTIFSFDILIAVIQESNRYPDDSIIDISNILNVPNIDQYLYSLEIVELIDMTTNKALTLPKDRKLIFGNGIEMEDGEIVYFYKGSKVYETPTSVILERADIRAYCKYIENPVFNYASI